MGITSQRIKELGLTDEIVSEPLGGAHRDPDQTALTLKRALLNALDDVQSLAPEMLVQARYQRLMRYGVSKGE
jgi:acetyl-CoA carboxylase carboxyl transferase subunit alpha